MDRGIQWRCGEWKANLAHGEFTAMIDSDLPFSPRTAQRLMAVAQHAVIANPTHGSPLPASWRSRAIR